MKVLNYINKSSTFIHPEGVAILRVPAGASLIICFLKCNLGNTITGGIVFPLALTMQHVVIVVPLSALLQPFASSNLVPPV